PKSTNTVGGQPCCACDDGESMGADGACQNELNLLHSDQPGQLDEKSEGESPRQQPAQSLGPGTRADPVLGLRQQRGDIDTVRWYGENCDSARQQKAVCGDDPPADEQY